MATFKLALSAGHYLYTAGKRCLKSLDPNETREWWLNDRIADRIEVLLRDYEGVEVLRLDDTSGQTNVSLEARANAANKWKADFYLAIHHNAGINGGSGGGITAYTYNGSVPQETLNWQRGLYDELIKLTGLKGNRSNGCPRADLYECRVPYMHAVLLELGFMDSSTDVPIILTQDFAYKCAQACVNVIVAKAGLKKKTVSSTVGSAYKVVTTINRYANASDAKAKANAKGTYEAGTYYIYNKYPNGLNGMYNISKDSTGVSAGSWINPSENVVEQTPIQTTTQKLYRVRKAWEDAKSQVGAFGSLDNAKDACQKAGVGYSVFDWDGKVVYAYVAPIITTPSEDKKEEVKVETTTTVTAVYDLDYPVKTKIIDKTIARTNKECVQAIKYILTNNPSFDVDIAKAFFTLSPKYGIDPVMAISQSILETGWFKYMGSAVKPEHHNYCGLGVTSTGVTGGIFDTIEKGVTAQLQHLFAYGCTDVLTETIVDPRFKYVTRGIAPYWQQLAGRWAVAGYDTNTYSTPEAAMKAENTYGQKILNIANKLLATTITDMDVAEYFEVIEPEQPSEPEVPVAPVQPNEPEQPKDDIIDNETKGNMSFVFDFLVKLIKTLISFFKNFGGNKDEE